MADEVHTFYVLPWLQLPHTVTFGATQVGPAEAHLKDSDPRAKTVRAILDTYKGLGGASLSPSLLWRAGGDPLDIADGDLSTLAAHRDYLSAAAIMGNEYFEPVDSPINDAHCDGYIQRYVNGAEHVSLTKRRREGQTLDGWPISLTSTQIPLSATPAHQFNADQTLLDALAALVTPTTDLDLHIESALPFFVQANRLSERTSVQFDLVFLGAAFERLFGAQTPIAASLADAVSALFAPFQQGSTTWQNRSQNGNLTSDSGPWIKRWVRELYSHRSSIHGSVAPHSNDWHDLWHAVIATETFSLSVKALLDQAGTRAMTDTDRIAADALDERIESLATPGVDATAKWHEARRSAVHRATVDAVGRALTESASGAGGPSTSPL